MALFRLAFVCFLGVSSTGCSAAVWQAVAEGLEAAGGTGGSRASASTSFAPGSAELLLFGGEGHKTFLGCLNCSKYDASSVLNAYGDYGSKYNDKSIFNPYGDFGSKYSDRSACNPYASDPPVIVDRNGKFFGRLTVNRYHREAVSASDLKAWIAAVCQR